MSDFADYEIEAPDDDPGVSDEAVEWSGPSREEMDALRGSVDALYDLVVGQQPQYDPTDFTLSDGTPADVSPDFFERIGAQIAPTVAAWQQQQEAEQEAFDEAVVWADAERQAVRTLDLMINDVAKDLRTGEFDRELLVARAEDHARDLYGELTNIPEKDREQVTRDALKLAALEQKPKRSYDDVRNRLLLEQDMRERAGKKTGFASAIRTQGPSR